VIETVAGAESSSPSFALKVKLSEPFALALGDESLQWLWSLRPARRESSEWNIPGRFSTSWTAWNGESEVVIVNPH